MNVVASQYSDSRRILPPSHSRMVAPRTNEKRLPVAGIPGKSPWCVPDMTHSRAAQWLAANRLINSYLKSGTAAKARFAKLRSSSLPRATTPKVTSSKTQSSAKRARTLSGLDDQAIAHSSSIRSTSEVAMTLSLLKVFQFSVGQLAYRKCQRCHFAYAG